jgi:G3E family GTPase
MAIPALIISGFLGSGKTTLVGHLLDEAKSRGWRLAIISNEFGDTGIDRALLDSGEEGFVELDGGCICCRLSDALVETVEMVLQRAEPDVLILETSGVALPSEILIQFWRPPLNEQLSDETVVIVVDGERVAQLDAWDETTLAQLEAADLILLNKCDRISSELQDAVEARLNRIAPDKPVLRTVRSHARFDDLIDTRAAARRAAMRAPNGASTPHTHERFDSEEILIEEGLTGAEILDRVRNLRAIRAKGFVHTVEGLRVVQGVGPQITLEPPRVAVDPALIGRVVVIRRVNEPTQAAHHDHDHD